MKKPTLLFIVAMLFSLGCYAQYSKYQIDTFYPNYGYQYYPDKTNILVLDDSVIFVSDGFRYVKSENHGKDWQPWTQFYKMWCAPNIFMEADRKGVITTMHYELFCYPGSPGTINPMYWFYRSYDKGVTWDTLKQNVQAISRLKWSPDTSLSIGERERLITSQTLNDSESVALSLSNMLFTNNYMRDTFHLNFSADSGQNWDSKIVMLNGEIVNEVHIAGIHFRSIADGFIFLNNMYLKTNDTGRSWSQYAYPVKSGTYNIYKSFTAFPFLQDTVVLSAEGIDSNTVVFSSDTNVYVLDLKTNNYTHLLALDSDAVVKIKYVDGVLHMVTASHYYIRIAYKTPTKISTTIQKDRLMLYPNPAQGHITLAADKLAGSSVRLLDLAGRQHGIWKAEADRVQIDVNSFSPGIYFFEVTNATASTTVKWIKE